MQLDRFTCFFRPVPNEPLLIVKNVGLIQHEMKQPKYTIKLIQGTTYIEQQISNKVGKANIKHMNFDSKFISKGTIDLTFSPGVGNNPSNPYVERNHKT